MGWSNVDPELRSFTAAFWGAAARSGPHLESRTRRYPISTAQEPNLGIEPNTSALPRQRATNDTYRAKMAQGHLSASFPGVLWDLWVKNIHLAAHRSLGSVPNLDRDSFEMELTTESNRVLPLMRRAHHRQCLLSSVVIRGARLG